MIPPPDGWKIGDICHISGVAYLVNGVHGGGWYVQDSLLEASYYFSIPTGHTMYYLSDDNLGIDSTYLKLDVRLGLAEYRD